MREGLRSAKRGVKSEDSPKIVEVKQPVVEVKQVVDEDNYGDSDSDSDFGGEKVLSLAVPEGVCLELEFEKNSDVLQDENSDVLEAEKNSDVMQAEKNSDVMEVEKNCDVLEVEKNSDVMQAEKNSDVMEVEKNSDVLEVEKNSDVMQAEKKSDVLQAEKNSDVLEAEKNSDVLQAEKSSDVMQAEKNSNVLEIEKNSDILQAEKSSDVLQVEKSSDVLQVEKESDKLKDKFEGDAEEEGSVKEELAAIARKRNRVNENGEPNGYSSIVRKKKAKKEEPSGDEVRVIRRVLRSNSAITGGCDKNESGDVLGEINRGGNESLHKSDMENNEKSDHLVGGVRTNLTGKGERLPMVKNKENGGVSENPKAVKVKCELSKLDGNELRKKKKKDGRGRPRKVPKIDGEGGEVIENPEVRLPNVKKIGCYLLDLDGELINEKKKDGRGRPRKVTKLGRPRKTPEGYEVVKVKKRGRGRPPKVQQSLGSLNLKIDGMLKNKLRRKPGRRPKVIHESSELLKGDVVKKSDKHQKDSDEADLETRDKLKRRPGRRPEMEDIVDKGDADQKSERVLKLQDSNEVDLETKDTLSPSLGTLSKIDEALRIEQKKPTPKENMVSQNEELELNRREVIKSVREKIVEILMSAGWTIQLRPRLGRTYLDSVYVSLSGRTHWSVTLAYEKLKQHYENDTGENTYYKAGFEFVPIPDNEIGLLKRVITKKRVGKKKRDDSEGELKSTKEVVNKKKKHVERSKTWRPKGRPSLHGQGNKNIKKHKQKGRAISDGARSQKNMRNDKRRTLLVRKTMEGTDSGEGGYIPYPGKRTVLAWMIDLGTVSLDSKVCYMDQNNTTVLLEGKITRDGIHCNCCNETLSISEFEFHSGSKLCNPFINMWLESGITLLQGLLNSWNKQPGSDRQGFHHIDVNGSDPNDDTCGICGDGGDLICCDGCPSTFHPTCLNIKKFPSGHWDCIYCSCKFCKMVGGNEFREHNNDNLAASELLTCRLCEEKYHQSCSSVMVSGDNSSDASFFCGKKCEELFENLEKLVGIKHDLEEGFSWTLIHRFDVGSSSVSDESQKCDLAKQIECNSKLAVALMLMDECFLPMVDDRSGINLIRNIVYNFGSNFNRLNYSGFFTVILQRGDEIFCAATVRIHGCELAEMPFIGTRYKYRRQGMCRRLVRAIESNLYSLGVERLVIPAISDLEETWTSAFGFETIEVSIKEMMKNMNLVVFPGVRMLQKPTSKHQIAEEKTVLVEGPRSINITEQCEEGMECNAENTCANGTVSNLSIEAVELSSDSDDAERKCLVDHDGETIVNITPHVSNSHKQHEDITVHQNASFGSTVTVNDPTTITLGIQPNQAIVSEEERRYSILPCADCEATKCGGLVLCAPRDENADEGSEKVKDFIVTGQFSFSTGDHSDTDAPNKVVSNESEVSIKNIVYRDSVDQSLVSNGDCFTNLREARETHSDCATTVQTSLTLGGIYSTFENSSKGSSYVVDPIFEEKVEDDSACCLTSSRVNGVENPVDSNCDPSDGAYIERNGHCKSTEVMSGSLGVVVETLHD